MLVVHTGVNKMLSNAAIIDNYKCNLKSLQEYHKFSEELIGNMIPPPLEVALSKNNISRVQVAVLDGYRYESNNRIYQELQKSPFWSLYHDNISKFNKEYNGIMVRGIDSSLNPLNVPYALWQMKGGVTAFGTANDLLFFVISYHKIKESAYETIQSHFARSAGEEPNSPLPPTYFKLGQLYEINGDKQEIHITLGNSMPVANTGDGIAVN